MPQAQQGTARSGQGAKPQDKDGGRSSAKKKALKGLSYEQQLAAMDPERAAAPKNETGMPDALKSNLEALSGLDLSDVRVHRGSSKPAELGAQGYTLGTDIYLAPGQDKHLPHEAWHVVQQKQGRVKPTEIMGTPLNEDPALEREADAMGERAMSATPVEGAAPKASAGGGAEGEVAQLTRGGKKKGKGKKGKGKKTTTTVTTTEVVEDEDVEEVELSEVETYKKDVEAMPGPDGLGFEALLALVGRFDAQEERYDDFFGEDVEVELTVDEIGVASEVLELIDAKKREATIALTRALGAEKSKITDAVAELKGAPQYALLAPVEVTGAADQLLLDVAAIDATAADSANVDLMKAAKASLATLRTTAHNSPVRWPLNAVGLDALLGVNGTARGDVFIDGVNVTPGRNKVDWTVGTSFFVCEAHPYDATGKPEHDGLHFHVSDTALGVDHVRGVPNGYMLQKLYNGWAT